MSKVTISAKATSTKSLGGLPYQAELFYIVKVGRTILGKIKAELNVGLDSGEVFIDFKGTTVGKLYQDNEDQAHIVNLIEKAAAAAPFSTLENLGLDAAMEKARGL